MAFLNGSFLRRIVVATCSLFVATTLQAGPLGVDASRLRPAERADPLEPWSLEPASGQQPRPVPGPSEPTPPTTPALPEAQPSPTEHADSPSSESPNGGERVLVVRVRQVLVSDPTQAERLAALLRKGMTLDAARQALDGLEVVERTRQYAIDELESDVRREIETLPDGGWSRVRSWRGRSALYQVVEKKMRARSSIPALGAGLDVEEQGRVTRALQAAASAQAAANRPVPRPASRDSLAQGAIAGNLPNGAVQPGVGNNPANPIGQRQPDADGLIAASVVQQEQPERPPTATQAGEVQVEVEIGLNGEVISATVKQSTDPIFNDAATLAAQHSTYQPASRNGIPERAKIIIKFSFVAPQAGQ